MEELAQSCCWGAQPGVRKSNVICFLKLGRPSLLPAGQGTPSLWECWQWHPKESTRTAGAQGSGCSEHPWLCCRIVHPRAGQKGAHAATEGTTLQLLLLPWILPSLSKTTG